MGSGVRGSEGMNKSLGSGVVDSQISGRLMGSDQGGLWRV